MPDLVSLTPGPSLRNLPPFFSVRRILERTRNNSPGGSFP
jgi:hypothetical protein